MGLSVGASNRDSSKSPWLGGRHFSLRGRSRLERVRLTFTDGKDCIPDFVNHQRDLIHIYRLANPEYNGEETTPVSWDKKHKTIVNNESLEIIKMFATEFLPLTKNKLDLYPVSQRAEIDEVVAAIYPVINNGVIIVQDLLRRRVLTNGLSRRCLQPSIVGKGTGASPLSLR